MALEYFALVELSKIANYYIGSAELSIHASQKFVVVLGSSHSLH